MPFRFLTRHLLLTTVVALASFQLAQAQPYPQLLKDINTTPAPFGSYNMDPSSFMQMDGVTYYVAYTANARRQLWRTDGTSSGTRPLSNNPWMSWEINSYVFEIPPSLTGMNNNLYFFTANKENYNDNSFNLMRSDTSGNLALLASSEAQNSRALMDMMLTKPTAGFADQARKRLIAFNSNLYFAFSDSAHGIELWKSNGTAAGTAMLKDLDGSSSASSPQNFTVVGNNLFFTAALAGQPASLWKTDGTAAGTVMLRDSIGNGNFLRCFTVLNNKLYFTSYDFDLGCRVWESDGTVAGTRQTVPPTGYNRFTSWAGRQGRNLIYTTDTTLMKFDGSTSTLLSRTLRIVNTDNIANQWQDVNGILYFAGYDGNTRTIGLWKTDGTAAGTVAVKARMSSFNYFNAGGTLYFAGDDSTGAGVELWKSDGTTAGTVRLSDFNTLPSERSGDGIIDINNDYPMVYQSGKVLLSGFNGRSSAVGTVSLLAASDGTPAGTGFVAPAKAENYGSYPAARTVWNNNVYFAAYDGGNGSELWKTDGTPAGTMMIKDLNPGSASSYIQAFTPYNGKLYFLTRDTAGSRYRNALWETDGTPGGTTKIVDNLGHLYYDLCRMTVAGSKLVFIAGGYVYVSDGTAAGTLKIPTIYPGSSDESIACNFAMLDSNTAILLAASSTQVRSANELWNVNLPLMSASRYSVVRASSYNEMVTFDGNVYLARQATASTSSDYVLWKTDGTTAGTVVANMIANPRNLTVLNNGTDLYYCASDNLATRPYYVHIRAGQGPVNVASWTDRLALDYAYSYDNTYAYSRIEAPQILSDEVRNNYLESYPYFVQPKATGPVMMPGGDRSTGIELITTDGTVAGTSMLKDIRPDRFGSNPQYLTPFMTAAGDTLLAFVANDGARGPEVWISDGSAAGTVNFAASLPGSGSLNPKYLTVLNGRIIFWGTSLEHGTEPYAYELQQVLKSFEEKRSAALLLYPNPAFGTITVQAVAGSNIEVFNITGVRVLETKADEAKTVLSIVGLVPGAYMVRVSGNNIRQTGRFVKQ